MISCIWQKVCTYYSIFQLNLLNESVSRHLKIVHYWPSLCIFYLVNLVNMSDSCNFGQPNFVRYMISHGFVRQSKRALTVQCTVCHWPWKMYYFGKTLLFLNHYIFDSRPIFSLPSTLKGVVVILQSFYIQKIKLWAVASNHLLPTACFRKSVRIPYIYIFFALPSVPME